MTAEVWEISSGLDTARVTSSPEDRAIREATRRDAKAYLDRIGARDIAEILGLNEQPASVRAPKANAAAEARAADRDCQICGKTFMPTNSAVQTCSRVCAGQKAANTRKAARAAGAGGAA